MAHTLDHEEEIYKIQRDIEKRDSRHLNTGQKHKPYAAKMSLLGNMPGETTSTKGQEIAAGLVKSILPDPRDPKEIAELMVDAKMAMKVPGGPLMKGGAFLGKRAAREILPTLDEVLEPVMRGFRGPQWQPALVDAGTGGIRTQIPTDVKPTTSFKMSAIPNTEAFPPGGRERGRTAGDRVTPDGRLAGQTKMDELRTAVKSNASDDELAKILSTDYAGALDKRYLDGRSGYYNVKKLVKDKELLNKVISKQDEIAQKHYKWMKNPNSNTQREFFEAVGDTYFNQDKLIYGGKSGPWRTKVADVSNWLKGDQWHHIFGNREAAEFLMSAVARDPLVGVNLARLLEKEGLTAAGVARNLMLMKTTGHKNFHRFYTKLGGEPAGKTRGVLDFADFGQAISDAAQKGHTYGPKVFDPETGVSLAGKVIPPDPTYVNELFSMIKSYSKANKRIEQIILKGGAWVDPKLKRIVPKGTKGAKFYDFRANDGGVPTDPEKLSDKIGRLMKILDET